MSATDGADDGAHPAEDALGSILLKEKFGDLCNAFAKEAKKLDEDLLSLLQTANYKKKGGALDTVARISHLNASACDAVDAARAHQNAYHQLENKSDSRSTAVRTVREAINTLHACHEDLTAVLAKTEHHPVYNLYKKIYRFQHIGALKTQTFFIKLSEHTCS